MKILMLSSTFPYPPKRERKQLRTFHLLEYLSDRHQITLLTRPSEDIPDQERQVIEELVEELILFPAPTSQAQAGLLDKAKRLGTFLQQGTPPQVLAAYSPSIAAWIDDAVSQKQFDVITCEDDIDEIYIRPQWQEELGTVLDLHSSEYGKFKQQLERGDSDNELKDQLNLGLVRRYEQSYLAKFTAIVTINQADKKLLKELNPDSNVIVIPNGVNLAYFHRRVTNQGGQRIVFVGNMDRPANIDAARFFALEIFPVIRQRYPEATLELVGAKPSPQVEELNSLPGIRVTGEVASVVEYLHWATVCIMPMRKGSGLKNRTLETLATGVPLVGSDRALAGLEVDGPNVPLRAMRANTVEEYVYAIGRLFTQPKLREKLSENGRSFVEKEFTWSKIGQQYEKVLLDSCLK
jgi:glycosyltransferase involved in cell wall biosynthesis